MATLINNENIVGQEFKTKFRFMVEFPKELNLPEWTVQSVSPIKWSDGKWNDVTINFIDTFHHIDSSTVSLFEMTKKYKFNEFNSPVKICLMDPVGNIINKWIIEPHSFEIVLSDFGYGLNELLSNSLILKIKNIQIKNN